MKHLPYNYLLLILFLSVLSCKSKKENEEENYKNYVQEVNGRKMIFEYHKDSVDVEHVSVLDSEEKIYKTFKLIDGVKNGLEKGFYSSGNKKYIANYVNDTLEGVSKWYYDDGKIKSIYSYEKARVVGNQKTFYENGNLKRYFSTNFSEEIVFDIQYDENNKEKPSSLKNKYKIMGAFNHTNFNKNDTIKYDAYFSTPKNIKIKYFYSLVSSEHSKQHDKYKLRNVELNNSKIIIDTLIKKEGIYILKEKIEINDISLDTVFFEEYSFKINVQ